jgi:hypothetical protein
MYVCLCAASTRLVDIWLSMRRACVCHSIFQNQSYFFSHSISISLMPWPSVKDKLALLARCDFYEMCITVVHLGPECKEELAKETPARIVENGLQSCVRTCALPLPISIVRMSSIRPE